MNEQEITTLIARLALAPVRRRRRQRAAILAAGSDSPAIINWIIAHAGTPEATAPPSRGGGLHGSRIKDGDAPASQAPLRYVLPSQTLS